MADMKTFVVNVYPRRPDGDYKATMYETVDADYLVGAARGEGVGANPAAAIVAAVAAAHVPVLSGLGKPVRVVPEADGSNGPHEPRTPSREPLELADSERIVLALLLDLVPRLQDVLGTLGLPEYITEPERAILRDLRERVRGGLVV